MRGASWSCIIDADLQNSQRDYPAPAPPELRGRIRDIVQAIDRWWRAHPRDTTARAERDAQRWPVRDAASTTVKEWLLMCAREVFLTSSITADIFLSLSLSFFFLTFLVIVADKHINENRGLFIRPSLLIVRTDVRSWLEIQLRDCIVDLSVLSMAVVQFVGSSGGSDGA